MSAHQTYSGRARSPQPRDLLAECLKGAGLVLSDAGDLQASHRRAQRRRGFCRAAQFLRLLVGLAQPAPARSEARLPRTGIATGGHFRPAQLLTTRLRRLGPSPLLLIQGLEILRRARRCQLGRRPNPGAVLDQRRVYGEIIVQNRHALDDSGGQIVLPDPLCSLDSSWTMIQMRDFHGLFSISLGTPHIVAPRFPRVRKMSMSKNAPTLHAAAGEHLVLGELLRLGIEAYLAQGSTQPGWDILTRQNGAFKMVQVKTIDWPENRAVNISPSTVRGEHHAQSRPDPALRCHGRSAFG